MNKGILQYLIFFILSSGVVNDIKAQPAAEKVKAEIREVLNIWNETAKKADVDRCLSLFDDGDDVILAGSDIGEICRGKAQIRKWLSAIFAHANFSWDMKTIDIDYNGKTAWVFVEGAMIVQWDNGQTVKTPYRFTGIIVRKNKVWKWRLFNGSIPRGEKS